MHFPSLELKFPFSGFLFVIPNNDHARGSIVLRRLPELLAILDVECEGGAITCDIENPIEDRGSGWQSWANLGLSLWTSIKLYSASESVSLETNMQTDASPLTTIPTGIESISCIECHNVDWWLSSRGEC